MFCPQARQAAQYAELAQCTFRPALRADGQAAGRTASPVVVRGLTRFLEKQEAAVRQKAAKAEREREARRRPPPAAAATRRAAPRHEPL